MEEGGVVAGTRVGVVIVIVPEQGLDSGVVGWFSFLLLFWLVISLLCWLLFWSLLLCSWGPGARIGSCMAVSFPLSYDFGCYFLHLMKPR